MGWKNLKEHFEIRHLVHATKEGVCIGSEYVPCIIVIDPASGTMKESNGFEGTLRKIYPALYAAPEAEIKQLLDAPDNFSPRPVTVFTYEGGRIREAFCDVPGWPNVTHEGLLMYENLYSTCKETVVRWALRNATCAMEVIEQRISDMEKELFLLKERHSRCLAEKKKLENDYPNIGT